MIYNDIQGVSYMKHLKKIIVFCLLIVCATTLFGCSNKEEVKNFSYVTIETNPAVEFVCDEKGIVVAVNGLNDDGKLLILDEELTNKSIEEASTVIIELTAEMGFTVSGSVSASPQEIKVSVSSNDVELQASVEAKVSTNIDKAIIDLGLDAKIFNLEAKTRVYFEGIVLKYDPTLTEEEVKELSYEELMAIVSKATKEKSEFISVALEEYYQKLKEYEFKLKYKQELANSLSNEYQTLRDSYSKLLSQYQEALTQLKAKEVEFFTSPDSEYVKAINNYNDQKQEVMKLKIQIAVSKEANESTLILEAQLGLSEQALAALDVLVKTADAAIKAAFDTLITTLENIYNQLAALEEQFPESIDFEAKLTIAEDYINSSKDELFNKFEETFTKETLAKMKSDLQARKVALKVTVTESTNK